MIIALFWGELAGKGRIGRNRVYGIRPRKLLKTKQKPESRKAGLCSARVGAFFYSTVAMRLK